MRALIAGICLAIAVSAIAAVKAVTHRVTGRGILGPTAQWMPTESPFGDVLIGESQERTVWLRNIGRQGTLSGTIRLDTDCDGFEIVSGGGPFALMPGDRKAVVIRFAPIDTLEYECALTHLP